MLVEQNLIDARLKHPNGAVVMATIKLFLHLSKDNQELHNDVLQRVKGMLCILLALFECVICLVVLYSTVLMRF